MSAGAPEPAARRVAACRRHLLRRSGIAAFLLAAGVGGAALPLAWIVAGAGGWRPGSSVPLMLATVAALGAALAAAWTVRLAWRRFQEERVVRDMEATAGLPRGRIRAQLELEATVPGGGSVALVERGAEAIAPVLSGPPSRLARGSEADAAAMLRAGAAAAGGVALLSLVLLAASPGRSVDAWGGLVRPVGVLNPGPLPPISVHPGHAEVARGDSVLVSVVAPGRRQVILHLEAPGTVPVRRTLEAHMGEAAAWTGPVTGPTRYRVEGDDGSVSPAFELRPLDPLLLDRFALELRFPPWTGLAPERRDHPPQALTLPAGTELRLSGRLMGVAESMALRELDGGQVAAEFALSNDGFEGTWRPRRSTVVRWEVEGNVPGGHRLPSDLSVEIEPDRPPVVTIEGPPDGTELPADGLLPLRVEAEDDWGLDWVELRIEVLTGQGEPVGLADRTGVDGRSRLVIRPVVRTASWVAPPGSRIRVWAVAADRGEGPGEGRSEVLEYRLPGPSGLRREAREQVERAAEAVARMADDALDAERRVSELRRDEVARAGGGSDGSSGAGATTQGSEDSGTRGAEGLLEALRAEMGILEELEALREALARGGDALGRGAGEDELRQLLDAVDRAFEAARGGQERREGEGGAPGAAVERLEAGLEGSTQLSAGEVARMMAEAAERGEGLRERLEALREELKEAAFRTGLSGLRDETAQLAAEQGALAEERAARSGADPGSALDEAQETLARRASEAASALERLRAGAPDGVTGSAQIMEALDQASQALAEAGARMETAAAAGSDGAGRRGDPVDAPTDDPKAEAAKEAAEAAEAAREAMEAVEAARAEARAEAFREALTEIAQHALSLGGSADALAGTEAGPAGGAALREGIVMLARILGGASPILGEAARELSGLAGEALEASEAALRASNQGRDPSGGLAATRAALHRVALAALDAGSRGPDGGADGTDGGAEALAEALQGLAEEQEALNRDAAGGGEAAGGQNPAPGAQVAGEELASRQEAVAAGLGELSRLPGGERMPGALEELAREADEIARALEGLGDAARIPAETLDRQSRLLERMLDAGRSLERDGPTEERRGRPGSQFVERPFIPALPEGLLREAAVPFPTAEELAELTPRERRLVVEYFQRIRREGPP